MKPRKIQGNLIITVENQNEYKDITEVSSSIYVSENATLTAPALTEVSGYIDVRANATLTAPALTEVSGSIDVSENATLTAPALTEVSSSIYVSENATLTAPALTVSDNTAKIGGKTYEVTRYDGLMFLVDSSRTSKGIKILSGIYALKITDNKVEYKSGFIALKENFTAHGETLKKAISDLQFKLVSEKLKNEPILPDTIINDNYYRLVTGACEMGVKEWRKQNGIIQDEITAKDLLPILEKSNAYGLEKFKTLIDF